jgi:hypothetical protein
MQFMVNAEKVTAAPGTSKNTSKIRCRQIGDGDLDALVDLLERGFGRRRTRAFWQHALACLRTRTVPSGMPRYGYLLENDGVPVGVILLIFATTPGTDAPRANVSSWYVEPAFRSYAPLLVSQALKLKQVTYLNISPAPHTWPILAAQGYKRYSNGIFIALPTLQRSSERVRLLAAGHTPDAPHAPFARDLMIEHIGFGCIGVWCVTAERARPFVFRPRMVKGILPCAQLIYCDDVADFVRFAGPIGRFLATRGRPFVILDANGPVAGLTGRYFAETTPKYFRGPVAPRLGDLSYTEAALFGI